MNMPDGEDLARAAVQPCFAPKKAYVVVGPRVQMALVPSASARATEEMKIKPERTISIHRETEPDNKTHSI